MEPIARRVCPNCGYEYEDWVEVCPDCNRPIETKRGNFQVLKGELDENNPQWTVVGNVPNAIMGNLIKSQLEDAGIPVLLMRSASVDVAEFSHNDYVPHDLRVPRNRLQEARQIIDSPADMDPMGELWDDYGPDAEEEIEQEGPDRPASTLPEGWNVLQSNTGASRTQQEGWYWSDERGGEEQDPDKMQGVDPHWQSLYDRSASPPTPGEVQRARYNRQQTLHGEEYDPYKPSKWIKIVYAILMLAMSLPFILSLLQNLWNMGR